MILPLKIALGVIVTLLLALAGVGWYAQLAAAQRDAAEAEVATLEVAVELAEKQAKADRDANKRLTQVLKSRRAREQEALDVSRSLQEKIDALSDSCTFSSNASRVLWEIYERTGGVQSPERIRYSAPTGDEEPAASD